MFKERRTGLACLWVAAVIVIGAYSVASGVSVTASSGTLWLMVCLIPPAVMLLVWPSAAPVTIAELLHAVNNDSGEEGRE